VIAAIANVNIGPSGAEIGGAFGARRIPAAAASPAPNAWKSYMRRATNSIKFNYLPTACAGAGNQVPNVG
jgi:hypothetical protein